ncbi:MAG: DotI/IcmL family type IV secretion protein [Alphaproteobacteria bacterium]|nr:DotI/IcmL family type IV secretion protein [Alphaproteobacteria bacterium]MDE2337108.1 DotI/IcmL family type IV secretion protein [Alphaproteobacteria bacterium]
MKKLLTGSVLAVLTALSGAALAQGGGAPAASPSADKPLPAWLQYKSPYVGEEDDIANPHRTTDEIETWAEQASADVLTFDRENYATRMAGFKKYFAASGWKQYADYLKSSHIVDMVGTDGYSIGAIVDEMPLIINQGTVNGAYNWILRMPVTVSFFTKDPETGAEKTGPSGKFYLFLDISRVASGGDKNGIAIADWRMESNTGAGH